MPEGSKPKTKRAARRRSRQDIFKPTRAGRASIIAASKKTSKFLASATPAFYRIGDPDREIKNARRRARYAERRAELKRQKARAVSRILAANPELSKELNDRKRDLRNARRRARYAQKRAEMKQQRVLALLDELKGHLRKVEWQKVSG
jgi:hypothetical protein